MTIKTDYVASFRRGQEAAKTRADLMEFAREVVAEASEQLYRVTSGGLTLEIVGQAIYAKGLTDFDEGHHWGAEIAFFEWSATGLVLTPQGHGEAPPEIIDRQTMASALQAILEDREVARYLRQIIERRSDD